MFSCVGPTSDPLGGFSVWKDAGERYPRLRADIQRYRPHARVSATTQTAAVLKPRLSRTQRGVSSEQQGSRECRRLPGHTSRHSTLSPNRPLLLIYQGSWEHIRPATHLPKLWEEKPAPPTASPHI